MGTDKYEKKTFGNYDSTLYKYRESYDCGKEQWRIILDSCKYLYKNSIPKAYWNIELGLRLVTFNSISFNGAQTRLHLKNWHEMIF